MATIYRYYGEPTNQFARYYAIDTFLKPNVFHLFFCGSTYSPQSNLPIRVFYCLYVLLFPLSILLVIKKIGGNQWFSLLSFLFLYNINVLYGFNGLIIAIPFVMFTFCVMLNYMDNRTVLTGITLAALLVMLFFMHALAALFALLIVFACSFIAGNKSFSGVVKSCMPYFRRCPHCDMVVSGLCSISGCRALQAFYSSTIRENISKLFTCEGDF